MLIWQPDLRDAFRYLLNELAIFPLLFRRPFFRARKRNLAAAAPRVPNTLR